MAVLKVQDLSCFGFEVDADDPCRMAKPSQATLATSHRYQYTTMVVVLVLQWSSHIPLTMLNCGRKDTDEKEEPRTRSCFSDPCREHWLHIELMPLVNLGPQPTGARINSVPNPQSWWRKSWR